MMALRRKPEIGETKPVQESDNGSMGCVLIPLVSIIGYYVLSSIFDVMYDTATKLDKIVTLITLFCLVVLFILGIISMYQDEKKMQLEKRRWMKSCTAAEVKILNRHGGTWDDGYRYHTSWWLELEMSASQRAASSNETSVSVKVCSNIYDHLKESNLVRIYFRPEAPLVFLLEDEL